MSNYVSWDSLSKPLLSRGWTISPSHSNDHAWSAYKTLDGKPCEHNDHPPAIVVSRWESNKNICKVEVRGSAKSQWYSLSAYSVDINELLDCLDEIVGLLTSAWNAMAPSRIKTVERDGVFDDYTGPDKGEKP